MSDFRSQRPALASAWQPFYSSSPSFSAHSTSSILSLQGKIPLPGHPKTLRDLTHASELLTLPSSFGAIQLGETFSSLLCINNEANVSIDHISLCVEIQTAANKVTLANFGGDECILPAGDTMENVVSHEIKELGQHVLACAVTYRVPPNVRHSSLGVSEDHTSVQTFRKFYKFSVTNPLSVKTKVHLPRSPSALLSPTERGRIFLEVHIQNLTQEPMWFENMLFECVEGWQVRDTNTTPGLASDENKEESLFSSSSALMQPQDMRQYIYILSPISTPLFSLTYAPGNIVPLGRLDISWRSSFGEPGRLLTSMLSRRIPIPPPPPAAAPASALPFYLQRNAAGQSSTPPRVNSPQLSQSSQSRPGTPPTGSSTPAPYRPGSPFRNRQGSISSAATIPRPQSPVISPISTAAPLSHSQAQIWNPPAGSDIEVDFIVQHIPREDIVVEKIFVVSCSLNVSCMVPHVQERKVKDDDDPIDLSVPRRTKRVIFLVIQHLQPPSPVPSQLPSTSPILPYSPRLPSQTPLMSTEAPSYNPRIPPHASGFSSPKHATLAFDYTLAQEKLLVASRSNVRALPSPYSSEKGKGSSVPLGVVSAGPSVQFLEPFVFSAPASDTQSGASTESDQTQGGVGDDMVRVELSRGFKLEYIPLKTGYVCTGGIRVLLVEGSTDISDDEEGIEPGDVWSEARQVRTLKEWDVVAELWVKSSI